MRTEKQLFEQAAYLIRNTYERVNGVNTYGYTPEPCRSHEYVKTYKRVVEVCTKYNDADLLVELQRNWQPK